MSMMEHEEESNKALIEELRKRFLSRGPELSDYNEKDLDKVQQNDQYVWLFLKEKDLDTDKAQEMMVECLRSRESFGINDLIERNIDRRLFEIGFLYPRNQDKNGNPLLLFHARLYKKELYDLNEVKKLFAFGIEKMACHNVGKKVTLIFDMQDAGLANMDMDLIKFIITCFQIYFPGMLEYLIVYETPWILTAAWKIVKTWLSTNGISKIKFVNKTEVLQYVNSDQLLTSLGGEDEFVYSYPPQLFSEAKEMKDRNKYLNVPNKPDVFCSISMSIDTSGTKENVKPNRLMNPISEQNGDFNVSPNEHSFNNDKPEIRHRKRESYRHRSARSMTENAGPLVTISPAYELVFYGPSTLTREALQVLKVTNTVSSTVAYKIKTTSPENFRVRPSSGPILPGNSIEVQIFLHPGHEGKLSKDKFLILSTIVPEQEKSDLSTMWKSIPRSSIMEQRLRCRYEYAANMSNENSDQDSLTDGTKSDAQNPLLAIANQLMLFNTNVAQVEQKLLALDNDVKKMFRLIIVLLIMLIITFSTFVIYMWRGEDLK